MLPLKKYLEDTYYELPVQAASSLNFNVNDLTAYRKVELSNSNYATATGSILVGTPYSTTTDWAYSNKSDITGCVINGTYSSNSTIQSEVDNLRVQIDNIKANISENKKRRKRI